MFQILRKRWRNLSLKDIDISKVTYFDLNNEINIPINGQIQLGKDKEALEAFLNENVKPNTKQFSSIKERINYLIQNNYYEEEFISKYSFEFIEKLYDYLKKEDFHFKTFKIELLLTLFILVMEMKN